MAKGAQGSGSNQHEVRSHPATAPPLADLGISKTQSSRWQKLAARIDEFPSVRAAEGVVRQLAAKLPGNRQVDRALRMTIWNVLLPMRPTPAISAAMPMTG